MKQLLKEIAVISAGQSAPQGDSNYCDNGRPFVKAGNLPELIGGTKITDIQKVSEKVANKYRLKLYPKGTVLFAKSGMSCMKGYVYVLPCEAYVVSHLACIIPKSDISEYLGYYFKYKKPNQLVKDAAYPSISLCDIGNLEIDVKDFFTRKNIVTTLQQIELIIALRQQEIQKLDNLVKARFVELFGLPVSNTKGWKTEQMNDVAPSVSYLGDFDDEVWLLNLDMVEAQTGRILDYLIVSKDEVGNSTCTFDTSNVLYSKLRPYLNKVVMPDRCGYATSELVPLQPVKSKINREYLAFMLRSDEFVNMINEKVAGAKMPRVSMGEFRKFDVPVPPMDLQKQFGDFVHRVDKSKAAVQKSLDKLQILFDKLMQEYFG